MTVKRFHKEGEKGNILRALTIASLMSRALPVVMDVTRRQEHTMLLEKAVQTFGHVDVVWREDIRVGGRTKGRNAG